MNIPAQHLRSLVRKEDNPFLVQDSTAGQQNEFYRARNPNQRILVIGMHAALVPVGNELFNLVGDTFISED